jgi:hypothetical protein
MRHRFALLALLAALVLAVMGCAGDPPSGSGAGVPSTTADAGSDPTTAPPTTRKAAPETTRPAPDGVIPAKDRQPAPDIQVTAFDGRTITLGGFRGQPVVVNFFESW